ncbi:MAG: NPCBM/NEW2 domain-containing protein [Planctomycetes bacterium]|nr:NPCBM/NEW2 domain-containing protein [Planctomycetota bacterium]
MREWQTKRVFMAYDSADLAFFRLPTVAPVIAALAVSALAVQFLPAAAVAVNSVSQEMTTQGKQAWLTRLADFGKLGPAEVRLINWSPNGPLLSRASQSSEETSRNPMADPVAQAYPQWMRLEFLPSPVKAKPSELAATMVSDNADPDAWQLHLTDGSVLLGTPAGGDADQLQWRMGHGSTLQLIPIDLLWVSRISRRQLPPLISEEHDLLVLQTSQGGLDQRRGWLEEARADGLLFMEGEVVVRHPWDRVQALQLLKEDGTDSPESFVWLQWRNGSMWAVQPLRVEEDFLIVQTPWNTRLNVPFEQLTAIERRLGPFQDLAEMPPDRIHFPQSSVLDWSPKAGRSVEGRRMQVVNRIPVSGWGIKAPTRMEWVLPEGGIFSCWVGVDREVLSHRERSPLEFRVLLDGIVLATSGPVEVDQPLRPLQADIPKGGRFELDVRSLGNEKSGGGHGNWVLPRVWR